MARHTADEAAEENNEKGRNEEYRRNRTDTCNVDKWTCTITAPPEMQQCKQCSAKRKCSGKATDALKQAELGGTIKPR
jgi:hypothetical protein